MLQSVADFFVNVWENLAKYAQTIRISDIADVLIVAFLCYKLLRLIRRTNTEKVLKTLLLLFIVIWISDLLRLNVLNYLLGRVLELGFLALVVVFQPELRRLLEQVGSSSISKVFKMSGEDDNTTKAIRQTVIAAEELSRRREGALIIFERKIKLDDIMKTGTMLEAETSAELMRNIFYPKAPLHDGAAIMRNNKIAAAGCMLPLSSNTNLSRDLGMRHRAGIGVSERTDAVAVIVSEETGAISVAVGGMLKRRLTAETLERLLQNELNENADEENSKKIFTFASIFKGKKNGKKESK